MATAKNEASRLSLTGFSAGGLVLTNSFPVGYFFVVSALFTARLSSP
jgi:hypothetical protein